jgi:hypothetical protein
VKRIKTALAVAALGLTISACTGGQTGALPVTSVNPVTTTVLQLSMGTANVNGVTGTNVVATLRQPNGTSILYDTPTLSGPFNFAGIAAATPGTSGGSWPNNGPSAAEIAGGFIGSTSPTQTNPPNQAGAPIPVSARTTFGLYGGLAATGFFQSNSATSGVINATTANVAGPSIVPYPVPIYGASATALAAQSKAWIGPPTFAGPSGLGTRDGTFVNGLTGAASGINVFDGVLPGAGTYTMSVQIPVGFDSNGTAVYGNQTKTAALAAPATCIGGCGAPIAAPVITPGAGGATITAVLPTNATGALLMVTDLGPATGTTSCYPGTVPNNSETFSFPAAYTLTITASGTYTLPANLGPHPSNSGTVVPTICTAAQNAAAAGTAVGGDRVTVQLIGYNYNLPALVPALSSAQAPAMPSGDADIGVSAISATAVSP